MGNQVPGRHLKTWI